jgi:hypothetical protein
MYHAIMNMPGFIEESLIVAFNHLLDSNSQGKGFMNMVDSHRVLWLRASPRIPNKTSQSTIFGKNRKTHLQEFPIPPPNLLALGKNHRKHGYIRAWKTRILVC